MTNLEKNLSSKHRLEFDGNGKFRILMISDIQETCDIDRRTLPALSAILDDKKPNLVVLGGDNCNGKVLKTKPELIAYIDMISKLFESRKIPWCHVFGNHDYDVHVSGKEQQRLYEAKPYCVSKHTGKGVFGNSNFVLPVFGRDGGLKFNVWGLDSNHKWASYCETVGLPGDTPPRPDKLPKHGDRWDVIRFDQLMWYYKSSVELEKYAGRKVDGMLVTHVPLYEAQFAVDNPDGCGLVGSTVEKMLYGGLNSGAFATVLERGDVKTVACGHIHRNDFDCTFLGIRMVLDACGGFSPPSLDEVRGGRIFDLTENETGATLDTYMVFAKDYIDIT